MSDKPTDDALLAQELNERDDVYIYGEWRRRAWYQRSAASNVMLAWAAIIWLVFLAITVRVVGQATELAAVGLLVVMGLELFVAIWLSRVLWRFIGAVPRQAIRLAARLWFLTIPATMYVVILIAGPIVTRRGMAARVAAGATSEQAQHGVVGATKGVSWEMLLDPSATYAVMSYPEAVKACAALNARLPNGDELAELTPIPRAPERLGFWLSGLYQQSFQFQLTPKEKPDETGHTFALRLETSAPLTGAVLCLLPVAEVAPPLVPPVATKPQWDATRFVQLVDLVLKRADQATLGVGANRYEQFGAKLTAWQEANTALEDAALSAPTSAADDLASADPPARIAAVALASLKMPTTKPDKTVWTTMLRSTDPTEARLAEWVIWRWARANSHEAKREGPTLLALDPSLRTAHALAAGAGVVPACEALAREAVSGPWPRNAGLDGLLDVKGDCARAAVKALEGDEHSFSGDGPSMKALSALSALGAAAGPALQKGLARIKGPTPDWVLRSDFQTALLEAQITRVAGLVPPRGHQPVTLFSAPLALETRPCTSVDFGLKPTDPLPFDDDRCIRRADPTLLAVLRDLYAPRR